MLEVSELEDKIQRETEYSVREVENLIETLEFYENFIFLLQKRLQELLEKEKKANKSEIKVCNDSCNGYTLVLKSNLKSLDVLLIKWVFRIISNNYTLNNDANFKN